MNHYSSPSTYVLIAAAAIALAFGNARAQNGVLYSGPTDVNASLGSFALFTCHGRGFVVVWLINQLSQFNIDSPLIDTWQIYGDGGNLSSVLNITAVPETNNSKIQCYIHDTSTNSYLSQLVELRVQGLLGPVEEMKGDVTTTSVSVVWSEPFTLAGVPILSYSVAVELESGAMLSNDTIPGPNVTIPADALSACDAIRVTVSANNEVGTGESNSLTMIYPGAPENVENVTTAVTLSAAGSTVKFSFQTETHCLDQWLSLKLWVQEDDSIFGPLSMDRSLPYPCGSPTATITGLPIDSQWKVKLWLENSAGVGTASEYVTFSTFSVQSANIADMGNGIVCGWCYFAEGAHSTNGCTFHLPPSAANSSTHRNFSIERKDTEPSKAMGCYINDCSNCIANCSALVYGSETSKGEDKPAAIITNINLSCYSAPASTEQNCSIPDNESVCTFCSAAKANNGTVSPASSEYTMVTHSPVATKATVVTHSPQATQAVSTVFTTTVPADETSLSAREVFLYITVPGVVVLVFLTFCGFILLVVMLIRHRKQAKLDNDDEEMKQEPKITDNPCYEGNGSYSPAAKLMALNPIYEEVSI